MENIPYTLNMIISEWGSHVWFVVTSDFPRFSITNTYQLYYERGKKNIAPKGLNPCDQIKYYLRVSAEVWIMQIAIYQNFQIIQMKAYYIETWKD